MQSGIRRFHALLTAVIAAAACTASAVAAAPPGAASSLPAKAHDLGTSAFKTKVVKCGDRWFTYVMLVSTVRFAELSAAKVNSDVHPTSPADRLNGIDYKGFASVQWDAVRIWDPAKAEWSPWSNNDLGTIYFPDDLYVVHKNGEWQSTWNTMTDMARGDIHRVWDEAIKGLSCTSIQQMTDPSHKLQAPQSGVAVHAATAGRDFSANTRIAAPPPPPPFVANAVLNKDYNLGNCVLPKGTLLMDMGHSQAVSNSIPENDVRTDPSVCPPARGSGGPIPMPKSVIQPLQ